MTDTATEALIQEDLDLVLRSRTSLVIAHPDSPQPLRHPAVLNRVAGRMVASNFHATMHQGLFGLQGGSRAARLSSFEW